MLKRLLLALCALMIVPTVNGQVIKGSLDSLRWTVARSLGYDSAGTNLATINKADQAINEAYQAMWSLGAIQKMDTITWDTSAVWHNCSSGVDTKILDIIAVYKSVNNGTIENYYAPLERVPIGQAASAFRALGGGEGTEAVPRDNAGLPRFYTYFHKQLALYPKPAVADDFIIAYTANGDQLESANDRVEILPEFYDPMISYACYRMCVMLNKPSEAASFYSLYNTFVNRGRNTTRVIEQTTGQ